MLPLHCFSKLLFVRELFSPLATNHVNLAIAQVKVENEVTIRMILKILPSTERVLF